MSQALRGDDQSPYSSAHSANDSSHAAAVALDAASRDLDSGDVLPEDKFHINLPKGVDQYTGIKLAEEGKSSGIYGLTGLMRP